MKKTASKLDWNRMLGFEQITEVRELNAVEPLSPKVGQKTGVKLGTKFGNKIGLKIGAKQGVKA